MALLEKIISGGQSGADQAGWRAAQMCGIVTGGWMPKDFLTEDGPCPEFAELFAARAMPTSAYPPRRGCTPAFVSSAFGLKSSIGEPGDSVVEWASSAV
jgi:hypothetical protein